MLKVLLFLDSEGKANVMSGLEGKKKKDSDDDGDFR